MQFTNEEEKLELVLTDKELEVKWANLRAWNYWGRIWRIERKESSPDAHTMKLMKARALTYRKVYKKIVLSLAGLGSKSILDIGCGTSEYHK